MNRLQKVALLSLLIDRLCHNGSWCGETHVQKATFFLQRLLKVPLGFTFVLYRHGPFSFDLRDELTSMRADGLAELEPAGPYGPHIVPTERSDYLRGLFPKTLAAYADRVVFVAERLGDRGVVDLESLATALYIIEGHQQFSDKEVVRELTELKPHITPESAKAAVEEVRDILEGAGAIS